MLSVPLVVGASFAYLLLLFAVAAYGDARSRSGRSIIGNAWVYALSMAVYCTAWTYFGSVGRAASAGVWFLPIYLGPTLAMVLAWLTLRKMIRIAKTYRITSIADFIASRYGKSPLLAGAVTLITVVGIVPYIALQLKAIASGYALLTTPLGTPLAAPLGWWRDSTFYFALALAGFTMVFGARHLDSAEKHEGMVAAIAFESVVKLLAFMAVGAFVTWGVFHGPGDIFERARAVPELHKLLTLTQGPGQRFAYEQWFALTLLSMLSVVFLPRQFQMMVVENVDEQHLRRAAWVFPLYLLLINLFVLPIAFGGLLHFGPGRMDADSFVLSLPLALGQQGLALFVFVGGLSAATGMVIVEAIAVSTMVCNDLVMPMLLRTRRFGARARGDLGRLLLGIRRVAIVAVLLLGYAYFAIAGEAYALVSIGLISFAAVAQFAPAMLGGLYWKGGTRNGALAGLLLGFLLWAYTLMLPSVAKSGWLAVGFVNDGPWGLALLKPEQLLGLSGLDNLTHALFWSLLVNVAAYVALSLWRPPSAREASQASLFVDVLQRPGRQRRRRPGVLARARPGSRVAAADEQAARRGAIGAAVRRLRAPARRREGRADPRRCPARAVRRDAAGRRDRQRLGARHGRRGRRGRSARPGGRDAHPRRGVAAARLLARARGQVAFAAARHRRAARRQRAAQEPGPPEGRLHVLGDARAAHAADLDPRALGDDGRRPRHAGRAAPAVPAHHQCRDRAAEPSCQSGPGHGQDRIRPRAMEHAPMSTCAS